MSMSSFNRHLLEFEDFQVPLCVWKPNDPLLNVFPGRIPKSPLLVFVNTRSGGQLGTALLQTFRKLLSPQQVFDLNEVRPDDVLSKLVENLEALQAGNDQLRAALAADMSKSLKLVVAGGDGTAGWLLGAAADLRNPIPVATIPLGTGNNLPFSFGWGKKNPGTDVRSTKKFLKQFVAAHPLKVDRWQLTMVMEAMPEELPPSMQLLSRSQQKQEIVFRGGFWNYFSLGMDAQVSYEFHKERRSNPEKFSSQLGNQLSYAKLGCTQGWFCTSCTRPSSKILNKICTVFIAENEGPWKKLHISSSIRSLVLLNLPSFSGGLDPWGNPSDKKSIKRGLTSPSVQDGKLEVVGFRDGWHGLFLLFPKGHGTRLAQAKRVKVEFCSTGVAEDHVYMRMDGEPWRQTLPEDGKKTSIEISCTGQGSMLARKGCIAERKDAYEHRLSITKHGLQHGLQLKSEARRNQDNSDQSSHNSTSH